MPAGVSGGRWLVLALVWACLAAGARAGAPSPPRLCVEYLPWFLYEDQALAVCARVEAEQAEPLRLAVTLRDEKDKVLASSGAAGTPKAGAPWRCECSLRLARGTPTALDVVLTKANGSGELGKAVVGVLNPGAALPRLRVSGMRLVDEAGRPALVRIEHRVYKPEERWPFVRWVSHKLYGERIAFKQVLLLGDDLGAPDDGYLAKCAAAKQPFTVTTLPVRSVSQPPSPPILQAVAALSQAVNDVKPDLAVLCLGSRDPDFGTDVLQFEHGLELIHQQLERRGCAHVVVASPVGPSHLEKRLDPYADAARRVAFTYRAGYLDLADDLSDDHWAGDAADNRLLLRFPNAKGHAALSDAILRAVARLRR